MGILAKDIEKFIGNKKGKKLGDILYHRFKDIDVDSVEEVRKVRERN